MQQSRRWQQPGTTHSGQRWRRRLVAALALAILPIGSAAPVVGAAESMPLPFAEGASVRIIQGYNGGTHQSASAYGLDLVLSGGQTAGAAAVSPFDGTIAWAFEPGTRTGCVQVTRTDGRYSAMLCHIVLDRPYQRGEKVARGQQLGVVGKAGEVGNNGTPHIHLELHAGRGNTPLPFAAPEGLLLEGHDLPATGTRNEHASATPIMSTNAPTAVRSAPAPPAPQQAQGVVSPPTQPATFCAPGTSPNYVDGFADLKRHIGDAMGDPMTCAFSDPNGSGDVHQRTTKGLAFWRKSTNTPTFTNGWDHWGHTATGWATWTGESIDPPTAAR